MTLTSLREIPFTVSKISSKSLGRLAQQKRFFSQDPKFFWMQNLARFQTIREWSARQDHAPRMDTKTVESDASVSLQDSLEDAHWILQKDGYYQGITLTPATLQSLIAFSKSNPCYGDRNPEIKFFIDQRAQVEEDLGISFKVASYFDAYKSCEAFQSLKRDPSLRELAMRYLGHEPEYHRGDLMWSFPRNSTQLDKVANAQVLHCDINDYKTVKFFFYITDVDLDSGPHVYIKGSHRNRSLWHQLIGQGIAGIPDETLIQQYGSERVVTACGPAGFGFVGDPYVLHKGITPTKTPRLLLQLEFGMNAYKTWYFSTPD